MLGQPSRDPNNDVAETHAPPETSVPSAMPKAVVLQKKSDPQPQSGVRMGKLYHYY